jgi:hypothetical protein
MKIGDQFKQGDYTSIYSFVRLGYTNEVHVFSVTDNVIMSAFKGQVKDLENIAEEEFRNILVVSKECLHYYTNLDGTPLFPEETYEIGDHFVMTDTGSEEWLPTPGEQFMLVQVNGVKALVSLSTGNYWQTGKEFCGSLTKEDLKSISGRATFEKVAK